MMPFRLRYYPLLLLMLVSLQCFAETALFEATYKGKYGGFTIVTLRRLTQLDDGTYELESTASNFFGSLTETSHFRKDGNLWRPLSYRYERNILGVEATEAIDFDWASNTASYTHSRDSEDNTQHALEPGMLDPALYLLRLQRDLILGDDDYSYTFVKRDRIRHYEIEASETAPIRLKDEEYKAIKLQRTAGDSDKNTYVWAVPELQYAFGKIVHVEEGDAHEMVMTRYQLNREALREFFTATPESQHTAVKARPQ